jgi:hypothetical protein
MYNCTAFRNGTSNFSFYQKPVAGKLKKHVIKNCISYLGGAPNVDVSALIEADSWQGFAPAASDFISLDTALALAPRGSDYSLPKNGFLRLQSTSQFVDKGVDVGLPYSGKAPDLGAFENGGVMGSVGIETGSRRAVAFSPMMTHGLVKADVVVSSFETARISLFDMAGKKIRQSADVQMHEGKNSIMMDVSPSVPGVYLCRLSFKRERLVQKVVNE